MDVLGNKLERCLQTIAVAIWITVIVFGSAIFPIVVLYLLVYTRYWWLTTLYLFWIYAIDIETSEKGGRPFKWVRSWLLWKYSRDYYPLRLEKIPKVELDHNKNYLFCCFPHGVASFGCFNAFATEWSGYGDIFPRHTPHVVTLYQNYYIPFLRDLGMALGGISSSAKSINYVLSQTKGGHVCILMVGGAAEAFYCRPGSYRLNLKNRKGFVKLALRNGTPLVPVLSFGETDVYDQLEHPILRKVQEILRSLVGVAFVLPVGRGFFQEYFGILPKRRKITTVVGVPMEVPKVDKPTKEQVDLYHEEFVKRLSLMFEEQKYNYVDDPESKSLIVQ